MGLCSLRVAMARTAPPCLRPKRYKPTSGFWLTAENMTTPRQYHTATLLRDGTVLVAGGGNDGGLVGPAELYDSGSGT